MWNLLRVEGSFLTSKRQKLTGYEKWVETKQHLFNWLKLDKLGRTEESFNLVRWQRGCTGRKRQMMCTGAGGYL